MIKPVGVIGQKQRGKETAERCASKQEANPAEWVPSSGPAEPQKRPRQVREQ